MTPTAASTAHPTIHWQEDGKDCSARWRSERGAAAPKKVVVVPGRLVNIVA